MARKYDFHGIVRNGNRGGGRDGERRPVRHLAALLLIVFGTASCDGGREPSTPTSNNRQTSDTILTPRNRAPSAHDVSVSSDLSTPYLSVQLVGEDPDGDAILYILVSEETGTGYLNTHIESDSGLMYITLDSAHLQDADQDQVRIDYRTSDSSLLSDVASVHVSIKISASGGLGYQQVDQEKYAQLGERAFDNQRLEDTEAPPSVDLSAFFPPPGDQGLQGSCVGWAVGYALKSYQERREEGWRWNPATIFSPAWIYNQINGGADDGAYIYDGLELIVTRGAASLSTMPYRQADYRAQPNQQAIDEALRFRAVDFSRVNETRDMKLALASGYPVVIGFATYENFKNLSGRAAVYNTKSGRETGGHAMTIVGYDDHQFDGAFRAINSWGTHWGDLGYVWLPYDFAGEVIWEAYVVTDAANEGGDDTTPDPTPDREGELPDLQVDDWTIAYNGFPGGSGRWDWSVINTGAGATEVGADVSLILSRDRVIDSEDTVIVYQEIPFGLPTGHVASASDTGFTFPATLEPGTYYAAVWVDDLNEIPESDEDNNIQISDTAVAIHSSDLADLSIADWSAQWDESNGEGLLSYTIINDGAVAARPDDPKDSGWDVSLALHVAPRPSPVSERGQGVYFLHWRTEPEPLFPNDTITREGEKFNLYEDVWDYDDPLPIPAGEYYMSLWVDDFNEVRESDDSNNISPRIDGKVTVPERNSGGGSQGRGPAKYASAFNGRRLPRQVATRRVQIIDLENGEREFRFLTVDERHVQEQPIRYRKVSRAASSVIFPRAGIKTISLN